MIRDISVRDQVANIILGEPADHGRLGNGEYRVLSVQQFSVQLGSAIPERHCGRRREPLDMVRVGPPRRWQGGGGGGTVAGR